MYRNHHSYVAGLVFGLCTDLQEVRVEGEPPFGEFLLGLWVTVHMLAELDHGDFTLVRSNARVCGQVLNKNKKTISQCIS